MNESYADRTGAPGATDTGTQTLGAGGRSHAVAGPFTTRDLVAGGSILVIFVGSVLPFYTVRGFTGNLWNAVPLFFLGIGILLPLAVAALFAARRLGPGRTLRIGSLSIDQFASVTAVLAFTYFFLQTVTDFSVGPFIALIGAAGLLAATTLAPHVPPFAGDFAGRPDAVAHVTARDAAPALPRAPRPTQDEAPDEAGRPGGYPYGAVAAGEQYVGQRTDQRTDQRTESLDGLDATGHGVGAADMAAADMPGAGVPGGGPVAVANDSSAQPVVVPSLADNPLTRNDEPGYTAGDYAQDTESYAAAHPTEAIPSRHDDQMSEPEPAAEAEPVIEAFWVAVPEPRQVFDAQTGQPLFMAEPGRWLLVLQDRGDSYVVKEQDDVDPATGQQLDGTGTRIGVMYDLSNLERGE